MGVWGWSLTDTQVWCGFEAVGADAAVTTHHVNTLTRTADVWILSTLITIWEEEPNIIIINTHYEIFPLHTHSPTHCWVGVSRYPGVHSQRKLPGTFRQTAFCWHTGPFWHSSISAHTSFTERWEFVIAVSRGGCYMHSYLIKHSRIKAFQSYVSLYYDVWLLFIDIKPWNVMI